MARLQRSPAIAKTLPIEARADCGAAPWPGGSVPGAARNMDLTTAGRRAVPAGSPPGSSGNASGQEEVLPARQVVEAARLSKHGAQQTRRPGRTDRAQPTSHMKPAVVISADLEAARGTALRGGGLSGCTTVRLKNVEPSLMPGMAIAALNANGFKGTFDFVHVPTDVKRRRNRGMLFINFVEPAAANAMYQSFHHQTIPGVSPAGKALEITPAYVQGFQENFDRHAKSEAVAGCALTRVDSQLRTCLLHYTPKGVIVTYVSLLAPRWLADCFRNFSISRPSLASFQLLPQVGAMCAATLGDDALEHLAVGTALVRADEPEPSTGRVRLYAGRAGSLTLAGLLEVPGAVYALLPFQGMLLGSVNNRVVLWRRVSAPASATGPALELREVCAHTGSIMALHLQAMGDRILVGDLMQSAKLLRYDPVAASLVEVAQDASTSWLTAVEMLSEDVFLCADDHRRHLAAGSSRGVAPPRPRPVPTGAGLCLESRLEGSTSG
ncbi:unnamed protein product [Prorocentrum cordatum]|uniref:RRM domain-containing protein n=1 Tax=Prorocentrum cordatum TaxID=2364126 RepID=A0ABN9YB94_9DINO|nr:unnamed protein product [Polarella glacialis]